MSNDQSFPTFFLFYLLAIWVIFIIARWKLFEKAGMKGWKSLIPFYASFCLCKIVMGNGMLFLFSFTPLANIIFFVILCFKLAKAYGRGTVFGILTIFFTPIMYLILAFSGAKYIGPQI